MGDDDMLDAPRLGLADHQQRFLRRDMAGLQHQLRMRRDIIEQHRDARKDFSVLGDGHLRPPAPHRIFGIEGRQPDHPAIAALHSGHVLDGFQVDAAHREVLGDAAEQFDARHFLAHQIGHRGGGFPVVLHHHAAHAELLGKPRQVVGVDLSRHAVGPHMRVEIDHARQVDLGIRRSCAWKRGGRQQRRAPAREPAQMPEACRMHRSLPLFCRQIILFVPGAANRPAPY